MMPTSWRSTAALSRRAFLVASTVGTAGLTFGRPGLASGSESGPGGGRAESTILFFLSGGASHIDMWDMKPNAAAEYRGPFAPIATSAPGVQVCEHLPLLAKQAHHLAFIRSVGSTVNTNDHHAGYYYNLTGHVPDATFLSLGNNRTPYADDWPYMGSVVAAKRPSRTQLPSLITLPQKPSPAPYTRPGQFAGRLGVEFDALYVEGSLKEPLKFQAPSLVLEGGLSPHRLGDRRAVLKTLDASRRELEESGRSEMWNRHQSRAFSLLTSAATMTAFDVASEPESVRARYGQTVNGMSLLAARRLVEAEVPFVTVFWKEDLEGLNEKCGSAGGWDTHKNNFNCLRENLLPEFDRAFSALIEDLAQRGLLDSTLVLITSEMGRTPKIGDPRSGGVYGAGRDHWTHCQTDVLAGGGIRGGRVFGSSDKIAAYPSDRPVTPADVTKTVYHAMGIHDLLAQTSEGRPYSLLEEGSAIRDLF